MWKDAGGEPNGAKIVILGALITNRKTTEEYERWFVIILFKNQEILFNKRFSSGLKI